MITANVIQRVFHLRYGDGTATCFAIDYENKQYLVTAKHVIQDITEGERVEIFYRNNWAYAEIKLIGHHPVADISVFSIDLQIGIHELEPTTKGLIYGQDVFFLGFPYTLQDIRKSEINRNFPFPLVKKATLSAMFMKEPADYFLLDGINNPGFSGGPVVFKEFEQGKEFKIAGVISGYKFEYEPIYKNEQPSDSYIKINTGIIIAYSIDNAIELIKDNPKGVELE